jgi:hypothetical protein
MVARPDQSTARMRLRRIDRCMLRPSVELRITETGSPKNHTAVLGGAVPPPLG